ncbi:uncharacterized protein THITE_115972 [Thermothielavioides terrestris NRRL 8126]|uniref:Uncharacterized protein n=1 Tax=Thermothielavioides terrestris (strain ATCC 38088 / NRRL 8126) TaxID=578455 RepID=G2QT57_THETT|nr:uncharacterized protein THITE_115972 [Thermothielavioides terrestris NRRL 8126]AEO64383.1 hypothetical protein THITE_115972 [Thermothielavioides terrestris NRRL 8126]
MRHQRSPIQSSVAEGTIRLFTSIERNSQLRPFARPSATRGRTEQGGGAGGPAGSVGGMRAMGGEGEQSLLAYLGEGQGLSVRPMFLLPSLFSFLIQWSFGSYFDHFIQEPTLRRGIQTSWPIAWLARNYKRFKLDLIYRRLPSLDLIEQEVTERKSNNTHCILRRQVFWALIFRNALSDATFSAMP